MRSHSVHHEVIDGSPVDIIGSIQRGNASGHLFSYFLPGPFLRLQRYFWCTLLPNTWKKLPFDQKLAWIMFGSYTLTLLTLIEMFALKK